MISLGPELDLIKSRAIMLWGSQISQFKYLRYCHWELGLLCTPPSIIKLITSHRMPDFWFNDKKKLCNMCIQKWNILL